MPQPPTDPIVGIDLGTTNSLVAAVIEGRPEVLSDPDGETILPSVVGVDPSGSLITGTVARNQQVAFPDQTVASVKRHMGSMEKLALGEASYTPPEISAMILRRLRDRASRALGCPVSRAVITVPAFFDESQRQATREAGELAGLSVQRIINEPTAATLVYHAGSDQPHHVLVYDFGGGTFDVSIVRMESGVIEVLSSKGDTHLGGDDFDAALMDRVADEFLNEHGVDLREDAGTRWRLLRACEQAKRQLSLEASATIAEEFIAEKDGQPINLNAAVNRSEYEDLIAASVDRTIACVDDALRDTKLTLSQIDDLVLVGGTTRTPLIQQRLREEFRLEPSRAVDPDLAVTVGAAIQGAMLGGESVGPVLVDVTGHTLGIEVMEGFTLSGPDLKFSPIIHRNSPLPASYTERYRKSFDDQTSATIHVYQGEHEDLSRNRSIGKFDVDLDSGGGSKSRVDVRFDLTLDGILHVTATQAATGKTKDLRIDNALAQFRDEQREDARRRLSRLFEGSAELASAEHEILHDGWARHDAGGTPPPAHASSVAAKATRLLKRARDLASAAPEEDAEDIREIGQRLEAAIDRGDEQEIESLCAELDDVLFYVE